MGKGLSLDIGMNTREVVKGSADIERALEGVEGTLNDLARDGDKSADKLEQSFTDALRDIQRESKTTGDKVGRELNQGTSRGKESLRELKTEGIQNIAETLSSTDGSIQGFADGVQGTLGGVIAGLAGISPVAAGVAGAAALGFGLVTTELVRQQEEVRKLREKYSTMYKEAAEDSRTFIDQAAIDSNVANVLFGDPGELQARKDEAQAIGVDYMTYLRAQAGDVKALKFALDAAREAEEKRQAVAAAAQQGEGAVADTEYIAIKRVADTLGTIAGLHEENQAAAQAYADYTAQVSAEERAQIKRTATADQERYQGIADQVQSLNDKTVKIPAQIETPSTRDVLARTQLALDKGQLRVKVGLKDRYGRDLD